MGKMVISLENDDFMGKNDFMGNMLISWEKIWISWEKMGISWEKWGFHGKNGDFTGKIVISWEI